MSQNQIPELRTIEFPGTPWTRWAGSLGAHAALVTLAIAVPWSVHQALQQQTEHVVSLVDPVQAPRPVVKTILPKKVPQPVIVKPVILPQPPAPRVFVTPKTEARVQPRVEVEAPAAAPAPVQPAVQPVAIAKIEVPKPAPPVKIGGFGDPNGVQPSANSSPGKLTAAKLGAFDLSEGSAQGKGSSGGGRAVALAGFGGAGAGGGSGPGGNGRGQVRSAGFGEYDSAPVAKTATRPVQTPAETPVEITFKPKPVYTPEAREKKIEGEVLLEVIFAATGQIHIVRVTRGLGFGLDERAREAAEQIRFQPGMRAGLPVDMKGTVHIVFELS